MPPLFIALALCLSQQTPSLPAETPRPNTPLVAATPVPALPGQAVTFRWPADAVKVLASGGGFGARTDLTGLAGTEDRPKQATNYRFTLWLRGDATPHHQTLTIPVYAGTFPPLATYRDPRGWRVDCPAGWFRSAVPFDDPANNTLLYIQPVEDSPERLAVAILPIKEGTSSRDLARQVMIETPTQYDVLTDVREKVTDHLGLLAVWLTFKGLDPTQDGIPTRSMALVFVTGGRGYVVSARVRASRYAQEERYWRSLVRSFAPATP